MKRQFGSYALVVLISINVAGQAAQAHWGKVQVTDGSGDNLEIHSYPFGLGTGVQAQDQLGDSFGYKKGIFGINRTTNTSVLGNRVKVHHGLISGTSVDVQSMFGDTVKSHKFMKIGPRITTVNLQGVSGLASGLLHHNSAPSLNPAMNGGFPGGSGGASPGEALARPESQPITGRTVDPNAYASPPGAP